MKWINTRSQWFSGLKSPFSAVSLNYYRMDRHMDGRMNGKRTDTAAYRNVRTHLKIQRRTEQPCLKLVGHLDPRHHLWTKSCYKVTEASLKNVQNEVKSRKDHLFHTLSTSLAPSLIQSPTISRQPTWILRARFFPIASLASSDDARICGVSRRVFRALLNSTRTQTPTRNRYVAPHLPRRDRVR